MSSKVDNADQENIAKADNHGMMPVDILKQCQLQKKKCAQEYATRWRKNDIAKRRTFPEEGTSNPPSYAECVSPEDDVFQRGSWPNCLIQKCWNSFDGMPSHKNRSRYPTITEESESSQSSNSSVKKKF